MVFIESGLCLCYCDFQESSPASNAILSVCAHDDSTDFSLWEIMGHPSEWQPEKIEGQGRERRGGGACREREWSRIFLHNNVIIGLHC